jgi:uncharacterized protein (TIGR02001 family)
VKKLLSAAVLLPGMLSAPAMAVDITGNAGVVSQYIFRGIPQSDGNPAVQGGVDAAWDSGFSAGTWFSSVDRGPDVLNDVEGDNGIEGDLFGGWGGSTGDFNYFVGGTYYTYTNNWDEDYAELNLRGGWKFLSLDVAVGEYDSDPTQDYTYAALKAEYNGFYGKVGNFSNDFDGTYYEVGYANALSVQDTYLFDYNIYYVYSDSDLVGDADNNLVLGVIRKFDIFSN